MKRILFFAICISITSAVFAQADIDKNIQLIKAAKDNNLPAVQALVEQGADVNAKRPGDGVTALIWAALNGNKEMVEFLIDKGADIKAQSGSGLTAFRAAKSNGHKDIMLILDKDAVPPENTPSIQIAKDTSVNTEIYALHKAAYEGNLEQVKVLIAKGADIDSNAIPGSKLTPLQLAVTKGHEDMLPAIRELNAKNRTKNVDYPRAYAEIVSLLIDKGANINAKSASGWTALYFAAYFGYSDMTELLIAKGADVNSKDLNGWNAVHPAASQGHIDIAKILIAKGADIDIFTAADMGDIERVKGFLSSEPNLIYIERGGLTPLHDAAYSGQNEMVKFFIEKGVDVNIGYPQKITPIYWAAAKNHLDTVELLISKGAIINSQSPNSPCPLFGAAWAGNKEIAELLIAKGANVNAKERRDWTPLLAAAMTNKANRDIIELLIAKGADVNAKTTEGRTPLLVAVDKNDANLVELLLAKGADVNTQDCLTPLLMAENKGYEKIAEILRAKGAGVLKKVYIGSFGDDTMLFGQWNSLEFYNPSITPRPGMTFSTFRWTAGNAGIRMPVTAGKDYRLQVVCLIKPFAVEPNIFVNGQYAATIKGTDMQFPDIVIPAKIIGDSNIAQIEIRGGTWIPAEKEPPSPDKRNLGIMVTMFSMESKADAISDPNQP